MEEEITKHESFGQIQFSRVSGRSSFYGSELEQNNYITLTISNSENIKTLTDDRYFATNQLIKVRMSSGQFAELITSMNIGSGVPCTIERLNNEKVELPEIENRKQFVHRKFKERMNDFSVKLRNGKDRIKELVRKKLTKKDVEIVENYLDFITTEVSSNIPYFTECFQETMDEVVLEAKLEVENAITHKIATLGLNELHKENLLKQ